MIANKTKKNTIIPAVTPNAKLPVVPTMKKHTNIATTKLKIIPQPISRLTFPIAKTVSFVAILFQYIIKIKITFFTYKLTIKSFHFLP